MRLGITLLSLYFLLLDSVHSQDWAYHTVLDEDEKYHLYWNPPQNNSGESNITFRVEVQAKGYFGLGFSPNGGMPGSDIVTGWIKDGEVYFQDRHADAFSLPLKDEQQDYQLIDAYENDTFTTFEFSRKLDTCDEDDWLIDRSTVRMLYAYSEEDPDSDDPFYHRENRGSKSVLFLEPTLNTDPDLDLTALSTWDILAPEVNFSSYDTLYWCKIYKSPELSEKQHIVYTEHAIQEGHRRYVHHLVLLECVGGTAEEYEVYVDDKGYVCHSPEMPEPFYRCQGMFAAWAVGGEDYAYPEHIGFPLDPGPQKYYVLEIHYDNPFLDNVTPDRSGLRYYYTPNLREYDAGTINAGAFFLPSLFIPPGQDSYMVVGHANPECVADYFPESGAKFFGVFPHSHLLGRAMKVRHFRGNEELIPILDDKYYDFNYQTYRFFADEITVLPNDQLTLECTYNTTERTEVAHGGLSTRDEMCDFLFLYYPRVSQSVAYSVQTFDTINKALNINVTNDADLDSALDNIDWDSLDIGEVQNIMRYAEQETQCYYFGLTDVIQENKSMISYPKDLVPYEPPPRPCN